MRAAFALGPFIPDALPQGAHLVTAQNVYPAANGYLAARGFSPVSDPIPAGFRGAASFVSEGGVAYLVAGTANGLARLSAGQWTDLVVALSVPGRWRFAQFGNHAIAVHGEPTYQIDLEAGTASQIPGAPTAVAVCVVGDHVVYAQPNGDILRVRWSAFGNHLGNTLGVDQCGDQPMLTGGEVMGVAGGEYGVILQRQRLVRMQRTGDADAPFLFDEITPNFGCASKASIAQAGNTVFFLSDRGFLALDDGQSIRPIGNEKFDRSFQEQIAPEDYERLWSVVDPTRSIVMWGIPGQGGTVWCYNWVLDRVSTLRMNFDGLFAGFENSVTLEHVDALHPSVDAMPYSMDDPRWSGGAPRLYVVQNDRVGTLGGALLPAVLETAQFAPAGERGLRMRAVWPDTDAMQGVTVSVTQRQRQGETGTKRNASSMQPSGRIPCQARGRYMQVRLVIDSQDWSRIGGFEVEGEAGGVR